MRLKAFKYRIYPTKDQASLIHKTCGCRRFIYNWALDIKQAAYLKQQKLSFLDIQTLLPELKKKHPWLKEVNSQSLQATLRDLDGAYVRFFRKQADFPNFKKRGKSKESFLVPQHFTVSFKDKCLTLPKLGMIKTVFDREPIGEARSITVSISKSGK